MKKYLVLLLLFGSCAPERDLSQQSSVEIGDTDRAMSVLATREGFNKALLQYADDNVVKPSEGRLPIVGKENLAIAWTEPGTKSISWEPFRIEASKSGELGYSLGNWKMTVKDTTYYGFYYTIWKKQADGHWKFAVDGGNSTPKPK